VKISRTLMLAAALLPLSGHVAAQGVNACGSLESAYGPYDYRLERNGHLRIVERFHFSPAVEGLVHGDSGDIGGDLNYVLMTSPNHHRALLATMRFGERSKSPQPPGMKFSIDCYFDRAIRFQPDDTVVRELFAQYLGKNGRMPEARQQLAVAARYAGDNALSHYNIGLLYFDFKDYDEALAQAHAAMELGYVRTELRDKLKSVDKWREPPTAAEGAASAASAAASAASAAASAAP
jgi:tetratricopeptide (TPR) repeat protein